VVKSSSSSFLRKQRAMVMALATIAVAIVGYFTFLAVRDVPITGDFVEGEHYLVLQNPRRVRGDRIEVMEFFSYACPHCYTFDPDLASWAERNSDRITLVRTPAIGSDYWRLLGRHFYTMEELGILGQEHEAFFREIHDVGRQFTTPASLARFYDGRDGLTERDYEVAFNSTAVARKLDVADAMGRRLQIPGVPTIVVDGKYLVRATRAIGTSRMLDVVDHVLAQIEKERAAAGGS